MTHVLPDPLLAAPDPRCPLLPASRSAQPWPHPPAAGATSFRRGSALRGLGHCFSGSLSPRLPDKQHILQNILWKAFLVPPSLLLPPKGNGQSPFAFSAILQDTASVAVYFLCIFLANVSAPGKLDCVLIMPGFPGSHIPGPSPYPVISEWEGEFGTGIDDSQLPMSGGW